MCVTVVGAERCCCGSRRRGHDRRGDRGLTAESTIQALLRFEEFVSQGAVLALHPRHLGLLVAGGAIQLAELPVQVHVLGFQLAAARALLERLFLGGVELLIDGFNLHSEDPGGCLELRVVVF